MYWNGLLFCIRSDLVHHSSSPQTGQYFNRDWSLITGRRGGGATKWEGGGASEVLILQKEWVGGRTSFSHAEGGAQQFLS